ncbi:MAG: hypothetical protein SGJ18_00870 [Pseudomonadota bacterium]|nr:hypothetical protein [Pseudomonadota bacterium]
MKSALITLTGFFLSTIAHAEISNSNYASRHQALIEKAVFDSCAVGLGRMTQLSSVETERNVDQGVIDLYFTTELELTVKVDQGVFDTYSVKIQSARFSAYDHEAKDWGIYAIESVACELQ